MNPVSVLEKYWGYKSFRPLQLEIIESVLKGNDTLALLPTGGGKSITYQVPGLVQEGLCIVITPLIALMKDQVENLQKRGIKAYKIHSGIQQREIDIILNHCIYGNAKFLYIAPERIHTELFQSKLKQLPINLIAVDEAHCISQWGYDFRPSYLRINEIRDAHENVPMLAVTATATPKVVDDIAEKLHLNTPAIFRKSFVRENLVYYVRNTPNKITDLIKTAKHIKGTGIVYVRNRKKTKEIANLLNQNKISADYYHAGLDYELRSTKQNDWFNNKNRIMVSTNAFGMGIDKPDVRFVIHFDLPDSLEEYFQEAGRAGRDQKKSFAVLLFTANDENIINKRVTQSFPEVDEIKRTYQALCNYLKVATGSGKGMVYDFDLLEFSQTFNFHALNVFSSLKILQQAGYIEYNEDVNLPSRIMFLLSRDDLYKFQVENSKFDAFIKLLLRTYSGLFSEYTLINEAFIARKAGIKEDQVYKYLLTLSNTKIISFIPRKTKPVISFLEERLDDKNLQIQSSIYKDRKDKYINQVKAVLSYASTNNRCRNLIMLNYFGDDSNKRCGECDVCQLSKQLEMEEDTFNQIQTEIKNLVSYNQVTLPQVSESLNYSEKELTKVIQYLLDNNFMKTNTKNYLIWNK